MKSFTLCALVALGLGLVASAPGDRGCIWIEGRCSRGCEEGTHGYTTGCGYLTPEATCDNPKPVTDTRGHICDYSACYCDEPTVRNTATNKCVPLDQCPKADETSNKDQKDKQDRQ